MQARLMTTVPAQCQDEITTVVIDEVHNRSAHSDYVPALTLAVFSPKASGHGCIKQQCSCNKLVSKACTELIGLIRDGVAETMQACELSLNAISNHMPTALLKLRA